MPELVVRPHPAEPSTVQGQWCQRAVRRSAAPGRYLWRTRARRGSESVDHASTQTGGGLHGPPLTLRCHRPSRWGRTALPPCAPEHVGHSAYAERESARPREDHARAARLVSPEAEITPLSEERGKRHSPRRFNRRVARGSYRGRGLDGGVPRRASGPSRLAFATGLQGGKGLHGGHWHGRRRAARGCPCAVKTRPDSYRPGHPSGPAGGPLILPA